jgi:hypothetical protein
MKEPDMTSMESTLDGWRNSLISDIRNIVDPHLADSGYRTRIDTSKGRFESGNSRPWKVWVPRDDAGKRDESGFELGGLVLDKFEGFSEDGVVTEFNYGAVWIGYDALPVEDLVALKALAELTFENEFPLEQSGSISPR